MRFLTPALLLAMIPLTSQAYYGARATEAELTYTATAEIPWSQNTAEVTAAILNANGPRRSRALTAIDAQVQHLMGTFQSASFRRKFGYPGVLGEAYQVRFTRVAPAQEAARLNVTYRFTGKVVFGKGAFEDSNLKDVPLVLPLAADQIYAQSLNSNGHNPCTDHHYNSEGDFWYFWDPEMSGCSLRGVQGAPLVRVVGKLKRLASTRASYPEYDQLYGDNGNGRDLDVSLLFGYINDIGSTRVPVRRDDAKTAFREVEADLAARGFVEKTEERDDLFRIYANGARHPGINHTRTFTKEIFALGRPVLVRVRLLLSDTSIGSTDTTFHRYLKNALEKSDIVIYDGHSGLGSNLDLALLPRVYFKPSKYQIFYFNGCSSYPYFHGKFFEAKGGSKKTEIITSGLPTFSNTSAPNAMAFLSRFLDGQAVTYQTILREMEESNAEMGTYLTGVSGDEDNRWKP